MATKTCFIDHLRLVISTSSLGKIFQNYETITNMFIPQKLRTNRRLWFAFFQFHNALALQNAIDYENGRKLESDRISLMPVKKDLLFSQSPSNQYKRPPSPRVNQSNCHQHLPYPLHKYTPNLIHKNTILILLWEENKTYNETALAHQAITKTPHPQHHPSKPHKFNQDMLKRNQKIPSQEKDPTPDCFQFEPC